MRISDWSSDVCSSDLEFKSSAESGLFSGWNEDKQSYDFDSWQYEGLVMPSALSEHYLNTAESYSELTSRLHDRPPHQDRTLQHPNCVYQILKRHYADRKSGV